MIQDHPTVWIRLMTLKCSSNDRTWNLIRKKVELKNTQKRKLYYANILDRKWGIYVLWSFTLLNIPSLYLPFEVIHSSIYSILGILPIILGGKNNFAIFLVSRAVFNWSSSMTKKALPLVSLVWRSSSVELAVVLTNEGESPISNCCREKMK